MYRKFVTLLSILFSLLLASVSFAESMCTIKRIDTPEVINRAIIIERPDGRTIRIIGHTHGRRTMPPELSKLAQNQSLSNEEFVSRLKQLIAVSGFAIEENKKDLEYLQELIQQDKKIKYIGYEATNEAAQGNRRWFKDLKKRLSDELTRRKIEVHSDVNTLLLVGAGASLYIDITNPEMLKGAEIIGVESEEAVSAHSMSYYEKHQAQLLIRDAASEEPSYLKNLARTERSIEMVEWDYDYKSLKNSYVPLVNAHAPERFKEVTLEWLNAMLNELKWRQAREDHIVDRLLELEGSSILFIGSLHVNPIAYHLLQRCD